TSQSREPRTMLIRTIHCSARLQVRALPRNAIADHVLSENEKCAVAIDIYATTGRILTENCYLRVLPLRFAARLLCEKETRRRRDLRAKDCGRRPISSKFRCHHLLGPRVSAALRQELHREQQIGLDT